MKVRPVHDNGNPYDFVRVVRRGVDAGYVIFPVPPRMHDSQVGQTIAIARERAAMPGVLFATSGTIGDSKLIVRNVQNLVSEASGTAITLGLHRDSNVLITTPITHSFGFGILMACAEVNANVYSVGEDNVFARMRQIRELMHSIRFDVVVGVPFVFQVLLRQPSGVLPPYLTLAGGETVPTQLIERWELDVGGPLRQEYGLSEVGVVTVSDPGDDPKSIGAPVFGCDVEVHNGELVVFRTGNSGSYLLGDSPETFIHYPPRDIGVRTGDLGYQEDDVFYLTGRSKTVVHIGGMNVVPEEVEAVIRNTGVVDEVVVAGLPGQKGMRLVAFITPRLFSRNAKDLHKALKKLPAYKRPRIEYREELPRTPSGKVDRSALRI